MIYKNMGKIFYTEPTKYQEIYQQRLTDEMCYLYDFEVNGFPAFVMRCEEIWQLIPEILRLDTSLRHLCEPGGDIPGVAINQFINSCVIDEVKLTNEIEGVHSTRKEIQSVMISRAGKEKAERENRLHGLVNKYVLLLVTQNPLDLKTGQQIRKLYDEIVLPEIKESNGELPDGEIFRKDGVSVWAKGGSKVLHEGLLPEEKIIKAMEKALVILNDETKEPLVNIAVFHYLFGYIHPFYDGNGRMARFISSCFLAKHLGKIAGLGLSYTIKENLSSYYEIFKVTNHVNNKGDMTSFVIEFLRFLKITMERIIRGLKDKEQKLAFYEEKMRKCISCSEKKVWNICYILLQAALFAEEDGVNIDEITDYLNRSGKYGKSKVRELIKQIPKEYLLVEKRGKTNYYSFNISALDRL